MATSSFIRCSVAPLPSVAAPPRPKLHPQITATTSSTTGRGDAQLRNVQLASGSDDEAREDHGADGEQAWSRRGLMGAAAALAVASQRSSEPAVAFDLGICKVDFCLEICIVRWRISQ